MRTTLPQPANFSVFLGALLIALGLAASALAQEEGSGASGDPGASGDHWRPTSGSLFGNTPPPQQSSGDDITERRATTETEDDTRTELLVLDLYYDQGVTFQDTYLERFETTLWEQVDASTTYRGLTPSERHRRLTQAAQMLVDPVSDDRADEAAQAIGTPYYLIPRIDVADRSHYHITVTIGRAGEGEAARQVFEATVGRGVDGVAESIADLTAQALSALGS